MAIIKSFETPQGVEATYHKLLKVEVSTITGMVEMLVAVYSSADARNAGATPIWHESVRIPMTQFATDPVASFYQTLTTYGPSYLIGGAPDAPAPAVSFTVTDPDPQDPGVDELTALKIAKLAEIKEWRNQFEYSKLTWDGSEFDMDPASQMRLQGALTLAKLAAEAQQPFAVEWTLSDNTTRSLTLPDLVAIGQALGARVMQAHQISRQLKQQLLAAQNPPEVHFIQWPAT